MKRSAMTHLATARLARQQARVQRRLAKLIEQECTNHEELSRLADDASQDASARKLDGLTKFRDEHVRQISVGQAEIRAHLELAARSDARATWHQTIAKLIWDGRSRLYGQA